MASLADTILRMLKRRAGPVGGSQVKVLGVGAAAPTLPAAGPVSLNRHQQQSQHRRERRKAGYEAVLAAHQRGLTQRTIAQEFGVSRKTARRFLQVTEFPEQAPRRRRTGLEPYREYLEKRWAEGCHNASRLCRELQQKGYTAERSRVKEFVQPWRTQEPKRNRRQRKLPGLRLIAFWLAKPAAKRKPAEPGHHGGPRGDCHGRTSGAGILRLAPEPQARRSGYLVTICSIRGHQRISWFRGKHTT
jgi:transposase